MRKIVVGLAAALAFSAPAAAQQVTQGQYGDVAQVSGGYQLTSDPAAGAGYGGIYFGFNPGLTLSSLTNLSADYQLTAGAFGGGSPRFSLFDSVSGGAAYIYFGTRDAATGLFSDPGTGSTGNYADLASTDLRVECNGFFGCVSGQYPPITFSSFVNQAGATGIQYITLDLDGGFTGRQQLLVTNFSVNGNRFGVTGAVPEPGTWAMMLLGFGGIGLAMRRRRGRANVSPQLAEPTPRAQIYGGPGILRAAFD